MTSDEQAVACAEAFKPLLLDVPRTKSRRDIRREEVAALKQEHGIFTHNCRGAGEWLALSMPECIKALEGYNLTEEERTCGAALLAGYCRLLDEAGLIEEYHKTEYEAVTALVERIERTPQYAR